MAQLETQFCDRQTPLVNKSFADCTEAGDTFSPGDAVFLAVKNAAEASVTVTVATPGQVDGINLDGFEFEVPASGATDVGPFPPDLFGEQGQITYSAVTTLTIAVIQYGD